MAGDQCDTVLGVFLGVVSCLLLISEILPYATSARCNSLMEGFGHACCMTQCLISNKGIREENKDLHVVNEKLSKENEDLHVLIHDIKNDIVKKLREEIQSIHMDKALGTFIHNSQPSAQASAHPSNVRIVPLQQTHSVADLSNIMVVHTLE